MSSEQENVEILKKAYALWNDTRAESVQEWISLMADDVEFRSLAGGAPGMEFTRDCRSKSDVERYFAELVRDWQMIHYTVDHFIAQGDRVAVLGSCGWKSLKTGKIVETPKGDFIRLRDGKVIEFFEFYDTAKAAAASVSDSP